MQIRKHLFQVSGGPMGKLGNVWALRHEDGVALVDAGVPAAFDTIASNLRYWGMDAHDVTHVLCTHGHDDHAGTAAAFQELGAQIVVGAADAFMLRSGTFGDESPFTNHSMPPCEPDIVLEGDVELAVGNLVVRCYAMPGHTDGSYIYDVDLDGEELLFTGDMFCCSGEVGDICETWWRGSLEYSSEKLGQSFARLWKLGLSPTVVMGGHGDARLGEDARDMIAFAYRHYLLNNR